MSLLERFITNLEFAVTGLVGALIAVQFHEELSTLRGKLIFIFTGAACAYFLTPMAITLYRIDPGLAGGVGFLLGAFGGALLAVGFRTIHELDLIGLLRQRFGRPGGE